MANTNVNHKGYQRRLEVIQSILHSYGLHPTSVIPVEYEEDIPFQYNNYIYKVELLEPATPFSFNCKTQRPGTTAPPESGISVLIIRLSNPRAEGLNNTNRVENEVAVQFLFRQNLSQFNPELEHILPAIYAWEPWKGSAVYDETGFGWTIIEYMPGADLDRQFRQMELEEKLVVVEQIADIFAALQKTPLPKTLGAHLGGLTFNKNGEVVGGQMPLLPPGPWKRYEDLWVSRFEQQLHDAERSWALKGWKQGGLRTRIDKVVNSDRVAKFLEGVDISQRTLVHSDFSTNNMLFDKKTKRVTALLDFDFSGILHPIHEYFTGHRDLSGDWVQSNDESLRKAVITGNFEVVESVTTPEDKITWEVAKAWDSALFTRGVLRPSEIKGTEKLEKLRQFEEALAPSRLGGSTVMLERLKLKKTPEEIEELIKGAADRLDSLLVELGA